MAKLLTDCRRMTCTISSRTLLILAAIAALVAVYAGAGPVRAAPTPASVISDDARAMAQEARPGLLEVRGRFANRRWQHRRGNRRGHRGRANERPGHRQDKNSKDDKPTKQTDNGPKKPTHDDPPNDDRPHGDRPHGDRPHDNYPHQDRPPNHIVCLGGRVRDGRCRCRHFASRRTLYSSVFACGHGNRRPTIPPRSVQYRAAGPALAVGGSQANAAPRRPATAHLPDFVPDQVLVRLARAVPEDVDQQLALNHRLQLLSRSRLSALNGRLLVYRIPDGRSVASVIEALRGDPRVTAPQPNHYFRQQGGAALASDAVTADDLQYALQKLNLPPALSLADGEGVLIAVLDTEIDTTHPDLAGAIVELFDAAETGAAKPGDHGTAIAGIIRAHGLLQGVAPGARILGVNVFGPDQLDGSSAATTASLLRGIDWAVKRGARVINLSLAGPEDDLLRRGIAAATGEGVIVVAAAGNEGEGAPPAYPAAYDDVIAVTATDIGDGLYRAANRGDYIDVAAPGVDILTPASGHGHLLQSGTSFAAAHISGVVALMLERDPALTPEEVHSVLTGRARDLGPPGADDEFGAGCADAFATVRAVGLSQ